MSSNSAPAVYLDSIDKKLTEYLSPAAIKAKEARSPQLDEVIALLKRIALALEKRR